MSNECSFPILTNVGWMGRAHSSLSNLSKWKKPTQNKCNQNSPSKECPINFRCLGKAALQSKNSTHFQRWQKNRHLEPGCLTSFSWITQLHCFSDFFHYPKLTALLFFFLKMLLRNSRTYYAFLRHLFAITLPFIELFWSLFAGAT